MVDLVIVVIMAIAILAAYYRGVVYTAISIGVTVLSLLVALMFVPLASGIVKNNKPIYDMMLYYFEGHEYINKTAVELVHEDSTQISAEQLAEIVENADMPLPLGRAVKRNVAKQVYAEDGIATLGDYFNQTIVDVVINLLSLILLFVILRLLFGFVLRLIDFGMDGLPVLMRYDKPIALGLGFLHGIIFVFVVFMIVPVGLTVVPKLYSFLESSVLGEFFYRADPFIRMIPTT